MNGILHRSARLTVKSSTILLRSEGTQVIAVIPFSVIIGLNTLADFPISSPQNTAELPYFPFLTSVPYPGSPYLDRQITSAFGAVILMLPVNEVSAQFLRGVIGI